MKRYAFLIVILLLAKDASAAEVGVVHVMDGLDKHTA